MDFYKKIKLTLLFSFGLFLFWFNCVYGAELDITNNYSYNNTTTYLFMDDIIMDYISTVPEYSGINTDYCMVGIINTSNSQFEFYFTPYSFGTPSQMYLSTRRFLLVGNFNYIKYSTSTINYNPATAVWTRSTGTNSGNTTIYTYRREETGATYLYYWGSDYATWFADFNSTIPMPVYNAFISPDINNWTTNTSSNPMTFTSVEDTAYIVVHRNSVPTSSTMILNCYDVTNGTNLVQEFELNQNSPFLSSDGTQYTIGLYVSNWFNTVSGNKYWFTLTYLDNTNNTQTLSYWFNLSYSSSTVENIQDNMQQDIKNSLENTENYLKNDNVDYNDIMTKFNDFEVAFSNPNDNYADNLFDILNQMFVSDTVHDFEFVIPNSNGQKIIIPANYIETHIPEIILVLIRIFYWYFISRYIIKDIWHIIDKLRQGDYFITNDKDIKTEIL